MVLGGLACFTRRRPQVRVLSRPPYKSISCKQRTQEQPTQIELLRESKVRILWPWQTMQSSLSISARPHAIDSSTLGETIDFDLRGLGRRLPRTDAPEGWIKKIERSREGKVWVGFFHLW